MILQETLRCPCEHKVKLDCHSSCVVCCKADCRRQFPIIDKKPILINEENSVLKISDFVSSTDEPYSTASLTSGRYGSEQAQSQAQDSLIRSTYRRFARFLTDFKVHLDSFSADDAIKFLSDDRTAITVLVIGSSDQSFNVRESDAVVYTDVAMGPTVDYICDAHDIVFSDGTFDLVIASAVLEHVADPNRCVQEIHRVLKDDGYVYAVTPFMQPVHAGVYDFTRFTYVGYRRLFRHFEEIELGMDLGPGSALAYSMRHFLLSFSDNETFQKVLRLFGLIITLPLKLMDKIFQNRKIALDSAGGFYFFGKRSDQVISDRSLVEDFIARRNA